MSVINSISVLVSVGAHPISGVARYSRNDALGLAMGLKLAKNQTAQLNILNAGDPNNAVLSEYLALGAPCVQVAQTSEDEDAVQILATHLTQSDLIITGSLAECGESSGLLPYLLAEKLEMPIVANVLEINAVENGLEVLQFLPKGKRRRIHVTLPALVAVHPLAAAELNYAHAQKLTGKIEVSLRNNGNFNLKSTSWDNLPNYHRPVKLKARDEKYGIYKSGHERMTASLVTESKNGHVVIEQNSVEKSQVILRYLREHHLIDC